MMTPPFDVRSRTGEILRLDQALSRIEGRRSAAVEREAELVQRVATAKGRLNARTKVEAFLEEVQADQNRRNVSSFETLLTALAKEVLPTVDPIRLELTTERNLPSLDIAVEREGGQREDVFEDNGGALTNVVSAGLRLIAVVKSGAARFVALDEADCWISPERVTSFYRVMEDAARRLGIQCFAISHHKVAAFGDSIHVWRLDGHPSTGVTAACDAPAPAWEPEAKGIRSLRLVDVQGYKDVTVHLSPGVTALTGENNLGKSTFARAFRALFLGETRDSLVRHGASRCMIEAEVEQGRKLRFVRQPKRNPVNVWSLHEADGSVVEEDGLRHETGGRGVPDWVVRKFGIAPVQDLDVHIAHQKRPVFLLSEPPSKRASVLSVGQESDYARRMILLHKDRSNKDLALVRDGEREIDEKRRLIAHLAGAEELADEIAGLRRGLEAIESGMARLRDAEERLQALEAARSTHERSLGRRRILADLPADGAIERLAAQLRSGQEAEAVAERLSGILDAWQRAHARAEIMDALPQEMPKVEDTETMAALDKAVRDGFAAMGRARRRGEILADLPEAVPEVVDTAGMLQMGKAVHEARTGVEKARRRGEILAGLPEAFPSLLPTGEAETLAAALATSRQALERSHAASGPIQERLDAVQERLDAVLKATGGTCPACGQAVADPTILIEGHHHP